VATLVVNAGRAITTARLKGSGTEPNYSGIGTGAGTAAAADTTLFTESLPRVVGTSTQVTTASTNDTYQVVATHTAGGALAITNAGLLDASTSGNLFLKGDFAVVNLANGDSIQFTYKAQYA
jgi:hypothetical protein